MKCPKCGFVIQEAGSAACPKCGVVFAKVRRASEEEAAFNRRTAAERSISAVMEKRMEADEEVRSRLNFDPDPEYARDEAAYPFIHTLSGAFVFLAAATAIIDIMGLIHFYHWGKLIFEPRELLLFMISLVVASVGSVVVLLAIAEGLKMGREVANNTRAMREYLRRMGGR
ncbi:zinc ribbon domain-containing protein [Desulfuromonas sp. TF]|uniref:zinc ribbon domain-containing protein n=1 Tax=Desulfuromonas sp. TF TaxID=1232410 RepID=UPI0012DC18F1|nr:zinc ribbon domain-containing protein [Desulfuromonas sp. TF]